MKFQLHLTTITAKAIFNASNILYLINDFLLFIMNKSEVFMAFTTNSIVIKVCSGDEISWNEFYNTYRPLVWLRGNDYGLSECEQEELLQQVMLNFFKQSKRFIYDPAKGKFRNYLRTIISHEALRTKKKRINNDVPTEDEIISQLPDTNNQMEKAWKQEWQSFVFTQALDELKNRVDTITFQAFEMYAIQGGAPKQVADFLDLSVNSVYVAKNRALKLLKEIIKNMNAEEEV
jgi:RNA polymerase sigma factor (sigma-70 family)